MGSYYYIEDLEGDTGMTPVYEDDMVAALYSVAKKHGVIITDKMILTEVFKKQKTSKQNNTFLYIDGTNLFAGQNELFGPNQHLSFPELIKQINRLFRVDKIFFYASYMGFSTKASKKLLACESSFYHEVKITHGLEFYKGHRSPTSGKEKGVDVHLAVDIVKNAVLGKCDQIVIMSGDADLIYPLEIARSLGVATHAMFLPNRFSLEMAYKADSATVLNYKNVFHFESRKLPRNLKIVNIKSFGGIKKAPHVNTRGR